MPKPVSVKVMLEYFHPWPNSAGFYLARKQGEYQQSGLDVELAVADPMRGDGLSYLATGQADFAITPANRLMVRQDRGEALISVAAINHTGLESIQTLRQSGITRPRDLCGKRLSMNPTPRGLAMVHHLVEADGGDPRQIVIVDAGSRELTPEDLQAGKADASFGGYWAWEALMDSQVAADERVVIRVDEVGAPRYHSYVLAARSSWVVENRELVQTFLRSTSRGFHLAAGDANAVAHLYEQVTPWFSPELLLASARAIAPTWLHQGQWGYHQPQRVEEYTRWLHRYGILQHASPEPEWTTNDLLEPQP